MSLTKCLPDKLHSIYPPGLSELSIFFSSPSAVIPLSLSLFSHPSPPSISPESLEVHGSFTWLGQTQFKLQLVAQEVMRVQLQACFLHAGVYNLGTPRVFAKLADQGAMCETSQQTATPALIIIINST